MKSGIYWKSFKVIWFAQWRFRRKGRLGRALRKVRLEYFGCPEDEQKFVRNAEFWKLIPLV